MAEVKSSSDHPAGKKGMFGHIFEFILKIIGVLIFSCILSIVIEWVGMAFFYPEEGYHHAEEMMKKEIEYLGGSIEGDGMNSRAIESTSNEVTNVIAFLFIDSGLIDSLNNARTLDPGDGRFIKEIKSVVAGVYDYLMAAIYVVIMFLIRLSILFLSLPAFAMFGLVGMADGLAQRDKRRWCGGNESGFIYHWAKKFAFPVLMLAWILYLSIPNSVHPNVIITPFAVLFGLVIMVMSSKFKKYL